MRIWLDTDIGSDVDDALALAYALRHPEIELVGVSTVFGDIEVRSAIARELLTIGGAPDVPVLDGLGVPLTAGKRGVMFGHEGRGLLSDVDPARRTDEQTDGGRRVAALGAALGAATPDVLVAIGPLTNVGALAAAGVPLPPLAIMGGKLTDELLPGMNPEIPEWNWFCDPAAVDAVLAADHPEPPLVVPAEITFRTRLADDDIAALGDGDRLTETLSTLCRHWLDLLRTEFGRNEPRVALHDPLTVAVLTEPSLCRFEERCIAVDGLGATRHIDSGAAVRAATDVDPARVRAHLIDQLLGAA